MAPVSRHAHIFRLIPSSGSALAKWLLPPAVATPDRRRHVCRPLPGRDRIGFSGMTPACPSRIEGARRGVNLLARHAEKQRLCRRLDDMRDGLHIPSSHRNRSLGFGRLKTHDDDGEGGDEQCDRGQRGKIAKKVGHAVTPRVRLCSDHVLLLFFCQCGFVSHFHRAGEVLGCDFRPFERNRPQQRTQTLQAGMNRP
ncbi:hypothetical protein SAMN04487976_12357 [Xaviernesmea oryzae]|nr:hypothetical protein SAMN04487976_12357 [Xaviernesmea oryzae]